MSSIAQRGSVTVLTGLVDLNAGIDTLATFMARAAADHLTMITSSETHLHNVIMECDSCAYDVDLSAIWYTKQRWNMLVKQYLDGHDVDEWLDRVADTAGSHDNGVAYLRTRVVDPKRRADGAIHTRRWGSCMIGFAWRMKPYPQLTMTSRTSYVGGLAALDLGVAHVLAEYAAERAGVDPGSVRFVWNLGAGQFHYFRCLAWWFRDPGHELFDQAINGKLGSPTARGMLGFVRRVEKQDNAGKQYDEEAFVSFGRMRRNYHVARYGPEYAAQFNRGVVPVIKKPVMLSTLNLDPIWKD